MLNQAAAFHHCHLGHAIAHLHTHEVSTNGATIAFAALAALNDLGINLGRVTNWTIART
jgi:hypothetical protein